MSWALTAIEPDEPAAAAACLARITDERPPVDPELALTAFVAEVLLAQSCAAVGHLDSAADRLSTDAALARSVRGVPGLAARIRLVRARIHFAAGHPEDVEPLLIEALEHAEQDDPPATRLAILAVLALASASATRPSRAAAALRRANEVLEANPTRTPPVALDMAIARDAYMRADLRVMGPAVARLTAAGPVYPDHVTAASVAFLHATLLVASGALTAAEHLLRTSAALHDPRAGLLAVYGRCELGSVLIARGRPREALQVLAPDAATAHEICGASWRPAPTSRSATSTTPGTRSVGSAPPPVPT